MGNACCQSNPNTDSNQIDVLRENKNQPVSIVKIPETKESDSLRAKSTDNLKNKPQENNKPLKKVSSLEDNLNVNIKQDQENKPIELERKNLKVLEQNQENKPSELDRKNSKPVDEGSKLKKHIIKTDKVKNTLRNNL